jgi:hypothetical protein
MKSKDEYKLDANESAFFAGELDAVKAQTYDARYPQLKATQLIPVPAPQDSGADTISWRSFDRVGQAKIIADYAKDFPRVDVYGKENRVSVRDIGASYGYSLKEIRRAMMAGNQLNARKALAARQVIETKINKLSWFGDSAWGMQGFINYPGIQKSIPAGANAAAKRWDGKTAEQILKDIQAAITQVVDTTNGVEMPNTMLLPVAQYNLLAFTPYSLGTNGKTILAWVQENYKQLTTIDWVAELKGAGDAGTNCAMLYTKDEMHVTNEILIPFEQFAPQQDGLDFKVLCQATYAGVVNYYPMATVQIDGI